MIKNNNKNENMSIKLIKNMMISKNLFILPLNYLIFKKKLLYNKEYNKIVKL